MTIRKLIALTLLLALLAPTAAAATPASSTLASPCTPGAAYDPACDVDHDGDMDVSDVQLAAGHWNQAGVWTGGDYWSLTGNAGTTPATHFLGTTDNHALELRVGGQRALKLDWTGVGASPNIIGGYSGNVMGAGVQGGVIGGGGYSGPTNRVYDNYGTVGGGSGNVAGDDEGNPINQINATVAGGANNTASRTGATISGGFDNSASGGVSTIGGGSSNIASDSGATVGGGFDNSASGGTSTIGGGGANAASDSRTTVGGGAFNEATAAYATIGGGWVNEASGEKSAVAGGDHNTASGQNSVVAGGSNNIASGSFGATIGGGFYNTANGAFATVPGGLRAVASHYGELATASGGFGVEGDAQASLYVLQRETDDDSLTELFLDRFSERITLAADRVMTFDILVVGSHRFGGGSSAGYQVAGVIRNIGGVTSFVGTPLKTVLGENVAGWDVVVEANDTVDALLVKVQGSADTTIRWVASVRTVEVGR